MRRNPQWTSVLAIALAFAPGPAPTVASAGELLPTPFLPLPWGPVGTQFEGQFGIAVAPAGDVDADGYGDVLVGAGLEDDPFVNQGGAYLFLGSATGSLPTHAWLYRPGQAEAYAGSSLAPAGDVNRDGYADVLIGVPGWDTPTRLNAGKVAVFHGGPDGLPATPTYELLAPVPAADEQFGYAVAPAGDVNGDGYDDVLVSSPTSSEIGFPNRGAVWVFHGGVTGLAAAPARTWVGGTAQGQFGFSISMAGDVNGDTFADVIVGAPGQLTNAGAAYLFLGSVTGMPAAADTTVLGAAGAALGFAVSLAGDVNGDGYGDVLLGSPSFSSNAGKVDLAFGGPGGIASSIPVPNGQPGPLERFGRHVATVGDIDADGLADFAVGASDVVNGFHGRVAVYRGGRAQFVYMGEIRSPVAEGAFGVPIATAGDANGDGFSEILLGTEDVSAAPGGDREGRAFQYRAPRTVPSLAPGWPQPSPMAGTRYGNALAILPARSGSSFARLAIGDPGGDFGFGRIWLHVATPANGVNTAFETSYVGSANAQALGTRLVEVGDMDRNGFTDFATSSPTVDHAGFLQAGRVDFFGGAQGSPPAPVAVLGGAHEFDRIGGALAGRGDVNGDGYHDLLIGAREWDSGGIPDRGAVWLVPGGPAGPGAPSWMREGSVAGAGLGASVAFADLDADGYSDVVVGSVIVAISYQGVPTTGKVEVYYGGPGGPSATPGLVLLPRIPSLSFGAAVAALGDVTADGVCDLGVGSPADQTRGRVDLYLGTRGRSQSNIPAWSRVGTVTDGRFGEAMAGGGDVDGDGFGDFVIGEPGWNGGQAAEGRLHLYHGANFVPEITPWNYESDIVGAELGASFAPLRDLNLDGFADLIVGAPGAAGRVYAFMGGGLGAVRKLLLLEPDLGYVQRFTPARLNVNDFIAVAVSLHSAAGRSRVGHDFEIRTQNELFTGIPTHPGGDNTFDTGAPGTHNQSLPLIAHPFPGRGFHARTRLRSRSPYFPRSKWHTPESHTSGDLDVWLAGTATDAGPLPVGAVESPRLVAVMPNPSSAGHAPRIGFSLPRAARVTLDVHDVRGVRVRRILEEDRPAGASTLAWDGRDERGRFVAAGLYFVRLRADGHEDRGRIVRLP